MNKTRVIALEEHYFDPEVTKHFQASGPEGYLTDVGLIPLPPEERQRVRQAALALEDNVDP